MPEDILDIFDRGESRRRQQRGNGVNGGGNSGMMCQLIVSQSLFSELRAVRQILSSGHSNLGIPSTEYHLPTATDASNQVACTFIVHICDMPCFTAELPTEATCYQLSTTPKKSIS